MAIINIGYRDPNKAVCLCFGRVALRFYNAFPLHRGRLALTEYRYDDVHEQLQLIKMWVIKGRFAVQAMTFLWAR